MWKNRTASESAFSKSTLGTMVFQATHPPRSSAALAVFSLPKGPASGLECSTYQPGEVMGTSAVAVATADNLYVAGFDRTQKRDAQGHWSIIATRGDAPDQVDEPTARAVDGAGNLYAADTGNNRVQKYTPAP